MDKLKTIIGTKVTSLKKNDGGRRYYPYALLWYLESKTNYDVTLKKELKNWQSGE
jgi:hypothetical protein